MEPVLALPERQFAAGEEPIGIRVTGYGRSRGIQTIMDALDEEERTIIQESTFGKFVTIAQKPAYSGRFGRFLISRQLNVDKKHEIWFLYAGHPIRFSIREFAIVTGLPCGKFPKKLKKRLSDNISETPYWPTLFGKLESVSVASVVKMLGRRNVRDREIRVKYACLALLASVLMPTTHQPKILKEHAEEIKDLPTFFAYPWGRLAFDMLISSIKERNVISLSQNTIAIKGFVHALQLVLVEAVPALMEVVQVNCTSSEFEGEGDFVGEANGVVRERKVTLSPAHARQLHEEEKTVVDCIIPDDGEVEIDEDELCWSDEEDDPKVDNVLKLIREDHSFRSSMFLGGVTKVDVMRMVKEAKGKKGKGKLKKAVAGGELGGQGSGMCIGSGFSESEGRKIAEIVCEILKDDLKRLDDNINDYGVQLAGLKRSFGDLSNHLNGLVEKQINAMKNAVINGVISYLDKSVLSAGLVHETVRTSNVDDGYNRVTVSRHVSTGDNNINQVKFVDADVADGIIGGVLRQLHQEMDVDDIVTGRGEGVNCSAVGDINSAGGMDNVGLDADVEGEGVVREGAEQEDTNLVDIAVDATVGDKGEECGEEAAQTFITRKSKRAKVLPSALVGDYQCDKRLLERAREAYLIGMGYGSVDSYGHKYEKLVGMLKNNQILKVGGFSVSGKEFLDIVGRTKPMSPKVIDMLMWHTRNLFAKPIQSALKKCVFLDTKFVTSLVKHFSRFSKVLDKDGHQFPKSVTQFFTGDNAVNAEADRFYFPFNFDKLHWVAICVDCNVGSIYILDSDVEFRNDTAIFKELRPVAQMFPYMMKEMGRSQLGREVKDYVLGRPRGIPQNGRHLDSAATSILLIQAHAISGIEGCRSVTVDVLAKEVERLSVIMFEENCEAV